MNAVITRLASTHDIEALCRLYFEFHEFHVRGVPDRLLGSGEPLDSYEHSELYRNLERIINEDESALVLAEVACQPVGLAEVYVRQEEPNPLQASRRYGHLQSLMVCGPFRREGIGARPMEGAQRWAKEKGAAEMRLETWEFAEGPLEFYERVGYRTLRRTLVREL
jgi:GNAT superfamily N-acetyltransferase